MTTPAWVPETPVGWVVDQTRRYFEVKKELNSDRSISQVLSLTLRGVVQNDPDNPEGLVPSDYGTYQIFDEGDLVFKLIDLENLRTSRVGLVPESGIMSSAYIRLVPRSSMDSRFAYWYYYSLWVRNIYNQLGGGVRATLGSADLLALPVVVPPMEEQRRIADFLDDQVGRIDQAIERKQGQLGLINEAFDAGLRETVLGHGSQDLGWASNIGDDRRLQAIGTLLRIRGEKNDPISVSQILSLTASRGVIKYEDKGDIGNRASEDISRYNIVRKGDIVLNCMNVILGSVGQSEYEGVLSPVYYVMCPINPDQVNMEFLALHFRIREFQKQLIKLGYGILEHRMRIPWINLKAEKLAIPTMEIQGRIVTELHELDRNRKQSLEILKAGIGLLEERKRSLITEAVTGQLDVTAARPLTGPWVSTDMTPSIESPVQAAGVAL